MDKVVEGFEKQLDQLFQTDAMDITADVAVLERMLEKGYVIGGEQSGHMIFLEYATTGDGQLTALQILALLQRSGKKASELFGSCARYPQVLINVPGPVSNADKAALIESEAMQRIIAEGEQRLGGDGRILVRPSGTEALIRVMVESSDASLAQTVASDVSKMVETIQKSGNI